MTTMNSPRLIALAIFLVWSLSGCAGAALVGSAVLGGAAETGMNAFQAKVTERAIWRAKHQELVVVMVNTMLVEAARLAAAGDVEAAMEIYGQILGMHEDQHPQFLIERLLERRRQ